MKLRILLVFILSLFMFSCSSSDDGGNNITDGGEVPKPVVEEITFDVLTHTILPNEEYDILKNLRVKNISFEEINFTSDNPEVASFVDGTNLVGHKTGETIIRAQSKKSKVNATMKIVVAEQKIVFAQDEIVLGTLEELDLMPIVSLINVEWDQIELKADNSENVRIEGTKLIALKEGEVLINATIKNTNNTSILKVKVIERKITFKEESIDMAVDASVDLNDLVELKNIDVETIKWKYNDTYVSISKMKMTALKVGSLIVIAQTADGKIEGNLKVNVVKNKLEFTKEVIDITGDETYDLNEVLITENLDVNKLVWKSSPTGLSVVKGIVSKLDNIKVDTSFIVTVTTSEDAKLTASIQVNVKMREISKFSLKQNPVQLYKSAIERFTYDIEPKDADPSSLEFVSQKKLSFAQFANYKKTEISIEHISYESDIIDVYTKISNGSRKKVGEIKVDSPSDISFKVVSQYAVLGLPTDEVANTYEFSNKTIVAPLGPKGDFIWTSDNPNIRITSNGVITRPTEKGTAVLTIRHPYYTNFEQKINVQSAPFAELFRVTQSSTSKVNNNNGQVELKLVMENNSPDIYFVNGYQFYDSKGDLIKDIHWSGGGNGNAIVNAYSSNVKHPLLTTDEKDYIVLLYYADAEKTILKSLQIDFD
ncbi:MULTISPECIES: hypothetical protein [Myroides]|nr:MULTISPECIES: hypothetical protein [Myroides]MVX36153.1 hypothetical protein [Myroides sp. LoEW2-1]UVD80788.1 hypothetical protein NWE55_05980 [Myroides albus]